MDVTTSKLIDHSPEALEPSRTSMMEFFFENTLGSLISVPPPIYFKKISKAAATAVVEACHWTS